MKFDLDAIQNETLEIPLDGETYTVKQMRVDEYLSTLDHKDKLGDDPAHNITVLRAWIGALAPELPEAVVKGLSLRSLYALLTRLDTFQGGVVGDDVGNVPKAGGSE